MITEERTGPETTGNKVDPERTVHVVCGVCAEEVNGDPSKVIAFCGFDKLRQREWVKKPRLTCVVCVELSKMACSRCGTPPRSAA